MIRNEVSAQPITISSTSVPDVRGLGLKDALYLLETCGWKVSVVGKGKVVSQSVTAGALAQKNQPIVLYLN